MKTPGGEGNINPEHQMAKLREQARSGGGGAGGRPHFGDSDADPKVRTEKSLSGYTAEVEDRGVALDLAPDANDKDMEELLAILQKNGFQAVLKELDRINNPHIEDDFHRLLVQYRKEGHPIPGLDPNDPLAKALDFILFEVAIPVSEGAGDRSLKEVFTAMEQLYQGLVPFLPLPDPIFMKEPRKRTVIHREHFVMELAVSQEKEDAVFYIAVHKKNRETFEKQVLSIFPKARIAEQKDDYNPFNQFGVTMVAHGSYQRSSALPIRTGSSFDYDPMNVTLAAFSKITKEGEGAAIQFCVAPAGDYHKAQIRKAYDELQKGGPLAPTFQKLFLSPKRPLWRRFLPEAWKETLKFFEDSEKKKKDDSKQNDSIATQAIGEKLKSPIVGVNMRIVASARTKERAQAILDDLEGTFGQYEDASGNRICFKHPHGNMKKYRSFMRSFIFRTFDRGFVEPGFPKRIFAKYILFSPYLLRMNVQELAALFHLTIGGGTSSREVKTSKAKYAPAPTDLPQEGILLGRNRYANVLSDIHFSPEDRMRHFYTIGQTGTGKTNFLKQMIIQDIENGEGVCFIDPHGVDVLDILSRIPPSRYDDLIYFDPAYTDRPMGLNMLEYDPRYPEQKTFVVDEMFQIFKKLYGDVPEAFGPIFEQYFRNATLLVLEDPETGSTLMDISRVLSDEDFRHLKLSRSRNPIVNHFWEEIAEQVRGEGDLRNVVPYITSKFDIFIANEIMRPIIGQQRSAFNLKDVMDNKKILLVNLSKGRLGDVNANLIGLIIVGKILMTALGRSEYLNQNPAPFFLYMDEFQNITTPTIATILSEARKYKLSLTMAHQFIKQLTPKISDAVFGNVGSMAVFRVGTDDAKFLETQFLPTFSASDMLHVDNYNAYVKMLAKGKPASPFSMETIAFRSGDFAQIDALKQMSYQRFGKNRDAIEEEIKEKYRGMRGV